MTSHNKIISETYDLFELNKVDDSGNYVIEGHSDQYVGVGSDVRTSIKDEDRTNPFRGFYNSKDFYTVYPGNPVTIQGKHFAPHAFNSVNVLEDGTIECFPPPVHPVGWKSVTFKCFIYKFKSVNLNRFTNYIMNFNKLYSSIFPYYTTESVTRGGSTVSGTCPNILPMAASGLSPTYGAVEDSEAIQDYDKCPLFIKWDEYPSRSKVVMSRKSKCLTYIFGQPWGPEEPIRLSLSLSGSMSGYDEQLKTRFNTKLTQSDIADLLIACSFSIEWEAMSNDEAKREE